MRPAHAFVDETLDELRGGDRPGAARTDILHVGDRRVDQLVIGIGQRKAPQQVARGLARGEQLVGEHIVIGEQAAMLVAERDDHRASQRGEIDDRLRVMRLLHPGDRVAQHQPAFGIGVEDLDRLARHRGDDITGALGVAVGHVLDQSAHADHIGLGLAQRDRLHRAGDRAGTAHVPLHVFHAGSGFQGNAAGVEGHALADQRQRRITGARAVPLQRQQPRVAPRALAHAEQRAHAEFGHFGLTEHGNLDAQPFDLGQHLGDEGLRIEQVGWLGNQGAGQVEAVGDRLLRRPGRVAALGRAEQGYRGQRRLGLLGQLGAIGVDPPAALRGAGGKARDRRRRRAGRGKVDRDRFDARGQQPRGQRATGTLEIRLAAGADAEQQHAAHAAIDREEGFGHAAGLALESVGTRRRGDRCQCGAIELFGGKTVEAVLFDWQCDGFAGCGGGCGKADLHESGSRLDEMGSK